MEQDQLELDIGDVQQVKRSSRKAKLAEERCQEELRQMLQSPGARYWIWRLLEYCRVFHTISANDVHNMSILSGRRDAGLWVLDEMFKADENTFSLMQKEAKERL